MSNVTWLKVFSENGTSIVVAYDGSTPVLGCRTTKKEEFCDFLNQYPNAHNIHVATANEVIPRVRIIPERVDEPLWIPWAKTPKNDQKLKALRVYPKT